MGQADPAALRYTKVAIRIRKPQYWVLRGSQPGQPKASASSTATPQRRDTVPDPHRNPTDETAHSGTVVMRVKGTENSRSAAPMRVNWVVGAFSMEALSG
jgi:hypothetical protein